MRTCTRSSRPRRSWSGPTSVTLSPPPTTRRSASSSSPSSTPSPRSREPSPSLASSRRTASTAPPHSCCLLQSGVPATVELRAASLSSAPAAAAAASIVADLTAALVFRFVEGAGVGERRRGAEEEEEEEEEKEKEEGERRREGEGGWKYPEAPLRTEADGSIRRHAGFNGQQGMGSAIGKLLERGPFCASAGPRKRPDARPDAHPLLESVLGPSRPVAVAVAFFLACEMRNHIEASRPWLVPAFVLLCH
ncbi:hypothetical protein BAE44_0012135 [Dichanthelium oligosanthes]|uniref:Uncharacterized protein n=1 Tax=Dichanthelium oligosanthes TaxID=888268 RepID=A0A1E5VNY6_9POAL|nr:hypothetical protein BAE44_0012135 [Dichanthelium oligosanthes]